jgi:hypothetical protein
LCHSILEPLPTIIFWCLLDQKIFLTVPYLELTLLSELLCLPMTFWSKISSLQLLSLYKIHKNRGFPSWGKSTCMSLFKSLLWSDEEKKYTGWRRDVVQFHLHACMQAGMQEKRCRETCKVACKSTHLNFEPHN